MLDSGTTMKADEFVCEACGQSVWSIPPQSPPPTRCATCNFLDEFVTDPEEREELRRRLTGPDQPGRGEGR
jgi:hypothetical protein